VSTRSSLRALIRLAPEMDTTTIANADVDTLLDKAQIDLALKGRALPKHDKFNATAETQEYVLSGAASVLADNDFLAVDLLGGGVLFDNAGSRWVGYPELQPKSKEWLDQHYSSWRTNSSASIPLYYYVDGASTGGISLGLVLLSTQHQLSRDTQNDLEEFIRIALIANYVSATAKNESSKSKTGEKTEQQNQVGNIATNNFDNIKIGLLNAAFTSRYFITKSDRDGVLSWGRAKDEMLFNEICLRRNEAPLSPFDYRYFTTEQIAELNKLYQ